MSPEAFLLYSIKHKCYLKRAWMISIFSVTRESEAEKKQLYPGKLIQEPFGFFACLEGEERVQIKTDKKPGQPLFTVKDQLTITREWIPTLSTAIMSIKTTSIPTSLGTLLLNLICLYEPFEGKYPYCQGRFTPSDLENLIAERLESLPSPGQPKKNDAFYPDELDKFSRAITYIESLSLLFTHSITHRGLLPAPGRKEFKAEVLKRYQGKLHDPVEMAKFEEEMKGFDAAYMKDDPSFGKFMSDKVAGARITGFMTQGGDANNFAGELHLTPIVQALEDGIPLDEKGFTAISNTVRYGSFARGAETVNGGVAAKSLMRAADNWRITEGDCGTKLGIRRVYDESNIGKLVGRYVIIEGKLKLIESKDDALPFIGRKNIVRSPQYCRRTGTQTCEVCAGLALAKYPTGLPIPLMEVSGGILADSLKQMHNTKLETATLKLSTAIT